MKNYQRLKLLLIYKTLLEKTDEQHPLTAYQLSEMLGEKGITCDRRTLSRDMRVLNECGIEVMNRYVGHRLGYYIEDREFSVSELKILVDAVQAANFITEKKSIELINKLSSLGGAHKEEIIRSNDVLFNSRKHTNEKILVTVSQLAEAINEGKKVKIKSFYLDENGQHHYRHNGELYIIEPLQLCFKEDNYYVICYDSEIGLMPRRVDRIERVEVIDESLSCEAVESKKETLKFSNSVFKMYGGEKAEVVFEFKKELIDQIFDRFGENCKITSAENGLFRACANVEISPTFWSWVFTYAGDLCIIKPKAVVEQYLDRLATMNKIVYGG